MINKGEAFDRGMRVTSETEIIIKRWLGVPRLYDARDRERERERERERDRGRYAA